MGRRFGLALAALAAATIASCGGGDAREGGSALFLVEGYPDLDPQLSYTTEGWQALWNTYIPLLTFKHAPGDAGTTVVPGLARSLPRVTNGGRTYALRLRKGLRYSDGRPVRASDFEFAVERMFDVDSGGSSFYTSIVGAADYQSGKAKAIAGIQTDDESGRIVIAKAKPSDTAISVWSDRQPPADQVGQYYQQVLSRLGFDAKLRIVNSATYFDTIANRKTPDLDTGFSNWFQDYPHPNDFFQPLLSGEAISSVQNPNLANLDDPDVNREIASLAAEPFTPAVRDRYAALDRRVMARAPWAPFGNQRSVTFTSDRIDFPSVYFHPVYNQDFTSFALAK